MKLHTPCCSKSGKKPSIWDCYVNISDLINFLRGTLMILSFVGVLFSIYVDHGNDLQCTHHMKNVSFYYITLSILFTVHYSLLLWNTAICMPFHTLTLAFFHYFSTFLTQIMIIVLLALGCLSCSIFESSNPIPLIACTLIAPVCFICNMGTACLYALDAKQSEMIKRRNEMKQSMNQTPKCVVSHWSTTFDVQMVDSEKEETMSEILPKTTCT